jgi:DNA primase
LADDRVKLVKQANDIVDVVGGYLALRQVGRSFKGLCPFHDDHRPSFDVDPERQRYKCWSCGKYGDVLSFVQEFERLTFPEALELLARRANIRLEKNQADPEKAQERARMLDAIRWAERLYHECYLDSSLAEEARKYLGQRGIKGETVRRYGIGFAPGTGEWLVQQAQTTGVSLEILEGVGLIAKRTEGPGCYDRFRDRVQFPIRDVRGATVGFGGRILPSSPQLERGAPKYYNSSATPLFNKSEVLYGLDLARHAAVKAGYLAVVEGYTDVLMAHQAGILQVVAPMGTALNAKHVQNLRRFVSRVVLVFDADAGGAGGVDRALEIFASHDIDLAIATLPEGLDPCDLIVRDGPEPFRLALESAVDALEFKLVQVLSGLTDGGVESRRRAVDAVLGIIALAPVLPGQAGAVKAQLMVNRIARRLALKEETIWARLSELRERRRAPQGQVPAQEVDAAPEKSQGPAAPEERELLELLLAEPGLVATAAGAIRPVEIRHSGLRRLLEGLYDLHDRGEAPTLDHLRPSLEDPRLARKAFELQDVGLANPDRSAWLDRLLVLFRERGAQSVKQELHNQLHGARDLAEATELLRRLQNRTVEPDAVGVR